MATKKANTTTTEEVTESTAMKTHAKIVMIDGEFFEVVDGKVQTQK